MVNVERKAKRPAGQIVLIDTPGVHKPINSLNRRMMKEVYDALEGCNLLLLIVDATAKFGTGDEFVLDIVKKSGPEDLPAAEQGRRARQAEAAAVDRASTKSCTILPK